MPPELLADRRRPPAHPARSALLPADDGRALPALRVGQGRDEEQFSRSSRRRTGTPTRRSQTRSGRSATTSRPPGSPNPSRSRRPPSATCARRCGRPSSICAASRSGTTSSASTSRATLRAMYAVTDGFSGLTGAYDTPGTGMNFLVHNMCRLPGSGGTWMIVHGGMGTVTARIADAARGRRHIQRGARSEHRRRRRPRLGGRARRRDQVRASIVVCNADPFRMRDLVGRGAAGRLRHRIDGYRDDGTTLKVNLALRACPSSSAARRARGQFGPTIHLLPDEKHVLRPRARLRGREGRPAPRVSDDRVVHPHDRRPVAPGRAGPPQQRALRAVGPLRARGQLVGDRRRST